MGMDAGLLQTGDDVVVVGRSHLARKHDKSVLGQFAQIDFAALGQCMIAGQAADKSLLAYGQRAYIVLGRADVEKAAVDLPPGNGLQLIAR